MFKSYVGYHDTMEDSIEDKSLNSIKEKIELAMGKDFVDYTSACIIEYNIIKRNVAQHYFSLRDKKWHRSTTGVTDYSSWRHAIKPIGSIFQWFLIVSGHKEKQDDRTRRFIQKRDIDKLYGR